MIVGKYIAQVEIEFHLDEFRDGLLPFDEIKKTLLDGELDEQIQAVMEQNLVDEDATVKVTRQYADVWKETTDRPNQNNN